MTTQSQSLAPEDVSQATPCFVHCISCGYEWIAAWWPHENATFKKTLEMNSQRCPHCGSPEIDGDLDDDVCGEGN